MKGRETKERKGEEGKRRRGSLRCGRGVGGAESWETDCEGSREVLGGGCHTCQRMLQPVLGHCCYVTGKVSSPGTEVACRCIA